MAHSKSSSSDEGGDLPGKLYDLVITSSNSRPRVSNVNAFAESAFKTLKCRLGFPFDGFTTLAKAQKWVQEFVE